MERHNPNTFTAFSVLFFVAHILMHHLMRKYDQTLRVKEPVAPGVNAPFWICSKAHYKNVADKFTDAVVELYF